MIPDLKVFVVCSKGLGIWGQNRAVSQLYYIKRFSLFFNEGKERKNGIPHT